MTRRLRLFNPTALALLLWAGTARSQGVYSNPPAPTTLSVTNLQAPASLSGYVPDDKYKLRKGDRISFQIMEDGDAPRLLIVTDSGELSFPYVGLLKVEDKSCKQMADELKVQLEKEYYYRATPVLALESANRLLGRIYLSGAVRSLGPMDLMVNENLTVGKAILRAGGFAEFANKKKVKLMRGSGSDATTRQSFELNMDLILEEGRADKDMTVQPEDFIFVPSKLINF
jgi:polysaccharide export outer membrane protein